MLHLILGPSGSGKSQAVWQALKSRAQAGQKSLLLVPEQFTSSTEGTLYATLGDTLSAYVDSYSFTSLAEALLRRYGGAAVPTLSEAGRAVLVRRALDALLDRVVYYGRQHRSAAFCEKAAQTIEELKSAGIRPEELAAYAHAPGADTEKLGELALIYATYEALLRQTALDPGDRVELAAGLLQADFFAGSAIYLDEFDTFNASKRAMLAAMLPVADVTVTLCCAGLEGEDDGCSLFSGARRMAGMLRSMAAQAGVKSRVTTLREDVRHAGAPALAELNLLLQEPGYAPEIPPAAGEPSIVRYIAGTRQEEAKAVAAAIRAKARAGMPYGRMAVICREAGTYLPALRYEFRLLDIPFFCDEPTTPEHTAPARAVLAALELLHGGMTSRGMLALLKTGLIDLPEEAQCALENYAYTWDLHAEDWRAPFTRSPGGYSGAMTEEDKATLALAEEARAFLAQRVQRFLARARGAAVPELTRQLYLFLQALGAEKSIEELAAALRARGEHPAADEAVREWNTVTGLLNELVQLLDPEMTPDAREYGDLFTLLLRTTDMGHIPQSLDSVLFTTAGRMRLPEVDACFVLGLAEGEFPQLPGELGLLTHADRDAMIAQGAELPDCFENRVIREQVCFYKALTAPRHFLWLSWPGGTQGGGLALPMSSALAPVMELLAPPPAVPMAEDLAATPAAALDLLGSIWQEDTPQRAAVQAALAALEGTPDAAPGYAAVLRAADRAPAAVADTAALAGLLGGRLRISPTRFEKYALCPFGYFMQYVLGVKPRPKAELAPNISGTLTHWVLEQALSRHREDFAALTPEQLEALVNDLAEEYAAENLPGAGVRMQYLLSRIRRNLIALLGFIQRDIRQSGFQPAAFELRIDDRPPQPGEDPNAPRIAPVDLEDGQGHTVRVVGTVDRVDTMRSGDTTWLRVVDYKTGNKKFDLKEVYYGLDCQMLLYLFTLERNGGTLFPGARAAGVEYLLADPAPKTGERPEADAPPAPPAYPLDGLLLDDARVYTAMDPAASGEFVPLSFNAKNGRPTAAAQRRLADAAKLSRIREHLDGLLIRMAQNLYAGRIAAEPFCPDGPAGPGHPCQWCDYRAACHRLEGEGERLPEPAADPFAPAQPADDAQTIPF